MVRLAISLFGPFRAHLDGRALTTFKSQKVRALLAYLAAEPDLPHPRSVLADLLWPNQDNQGAQRNLRDTLSDLRRVLGDRHSCPPLLYIEREALQLSSHTQVSVDAREFLICTRLDHSPPPEDLQRAVALYRGPFLDGFAVASAPYEEWLLLRRAEYARLMREALRGLAEHHEARGDWAEMARWARRQVELGPWDEGAHRQLMRALALEGQRGAALAQYEVCRRALSEGLGVDPEPQTQALFHEILEGALAPPAVVTALPPPAPAPRPQGISFVGREAELTRLWGHLQGAVAGQGRVTMVTGEPGAGKTWLVQELARQAVVAHPNLVVALGRCNAYAGIGDPYLPFIHMLRALCGDLGDQWPDGVLPERNAERLQALIPHVVEVLAGEGRELLGAMVAGEALLERLRARAPQHETLLARLEEAVVRAQRQNPVPQTHLFDQYARLLRALAARRPLLLVIDDLQWADAESISLFFHLGRGLAGSRVLLLAAYRPQDIGRGREGQPHPLLAAITELRQAYPDAWVDLNASDGRAFVDGLLDAQPSRLDASFREVLHRHTGGHALFTVELLRGLQERGDLRRGQGGRWEASDVLDWAHLPERVLGLIAERTGALSQQHRELLEVASVEGELFSAEVLARVSGAEVSEVLRLLGTEPLRDRLVAAQAVVSLGGRRLTRYRFRHALYQSYLYGSLDIGRRAHLHEEVGRALEGLYGEQTAEVCVALALHYGEAGLALRAAPHLAEAAWRSLRLAAVIEASAHCRRGLHMLEMEPESAERAGHEVRLLMLLVRATVMHKDHTVPELRALLEQAEGLCRRYALHRELSVTLGWRSAIELPASDPLACQLGEEAVFLGKMIDEPQILALAHYRLAMALANGGELCRAREHYECAIGLSKATWGDARVCMDPSELLTRSLAECAYALWALGYPDRAVEWCDRAVALAKEAGWAYTVNYVHCMAAWVLLYLGDRQAAEEHLGVEKSLGESQLGKPADHALRFKLLRMWTAIARGGQEHLLGEMLEDLEAYREWGPAQYTDLLLLVLVIEACVRWGRPQEGLLLAEEGLSIAKDVGAHFACGFLHRVRGEALLCIDEDEQAAEVCFRKALEVAQSQQAKSVELSAAIRLARLWQAQGRSDEARALLEPLYRWFTEGFGTAVLREARALLGDLGAST